MCTNEHFGHNIHHTFTGLNVKWYTCVTDNFEHNFNHMLNGLNVKWYICVPVSIWDIAFITRFLVLMWSGRYVYQWAFGKQFTSHVNWPQCQVVHMCTSEYLGHSFHKTFTSLDVKWYVCVPVRILDIIFFTSSLALMSSGTYVYRWEFGI
jgi:hypothetical protein